MKRFFLVSLILSAVVSAEGDSPVIKVACVGDSITEGAGLGNATYPAKLGQLLGSGYSVRNYGLGGRTLLKNGDFPYWDETAYELSRSWEPDIVIIKLGTNDSKSWNWEFGSEYVSDFEEFIASYADLQSQPRILLATPCPVFDEGDFGITPAVIADEIAPAVRELVTRLGLEQIDYHERMAGHSEWFPDTVHPDAHGTTVMAALAYEVIVPSASVPSQPTLIIRPDGSSQVAEWRLDAAGYVLQERADFRDPDPRFPVSRQIARFWTVTSLVTVNDGQALTVDIGTSRRQSFYRLWRP